MQRVWENLAMFYCKNSFKASISDVVVEAILKYKKGKNISYKQSFSTKEELELNAEKH